MNILILSPSLNTHGGIRILVDMANMLHDKGHHVVFHSVEQGNEQWAGLRTYYTHGRDLYLLGYDAIIAGSPLLATAIKDQPGNKFFFCQMAEEMFRPDDHHWYVTCMQAYFSGMTIITISNWLYYRLRSIGVNSPIHLIDLGVDHIFKPIEGVEKDGILVANWNSQNPAKDVDRLGPRVAQFLKQKYGLKIYAYGAEAPIDFKEVPDVFITNANNLQLLELYNKSMFTLQATRFDCKSLVGQESISCGTPVCRALISGDEDLKHLYNSVRCHYTIDELLYWADKITADTELRSFLQSNCKPVHWDISIIERILLFQLPENV